MNTLSITNTAEIYTWVYFISAVSGILVSFGAYTKIVRNESLQQNNIWPIIWPIVAALSFYFCFRLGENLELVCFWQGISLVLPALLGIALGRIIGSRDEGDVDDDNIDEYEERAILEDLKDGRIG